jgi:hypothetical protein
MEKDLLQAYKQAPWRTQIQRVGAFLLIVVVIAVIAGLYLNISGQSAATGRRIQNLESELANLKRENNDLQTQLGAIESVRELSARLDTLNMRPLTIEEALYLEVPGYIPAGGPRLAPPPVIKAEPSPILLPEFTSGFVEWLSQKLQTGTSETVPTDEAQQ